MTPKGCGRWATRRSRRTRTICSITYSLPLALPDSALTAEAGLLLLPLLALSPAVLALVPAPALALETWMSQLLNQLLCEF